MKKRDAHWYPRYYRDYAEDTAHLSLAEHGAYTLALDEYYRTGKPLIANGIAIARLLRATNADEIAAVNSVLQQFFVKVDGFFHHKRADAEIAKRSELIGLRKELGEKGNKLRWNQDRKSDGNRDRNSDGKSDPIRDRKVDRQLTIENAAATGQNPTPEQPTGTTPKNPVAKVATAGSRVWDAYSDAYTRRYKVPPVRNAKANSLCKQFAERLGDNGESVEVAAFYLRHNAQFYVIKGHSLDLMVSDAEKLRTEWATGYRATAAGARDADKTQKNGDVFVKMISEAGGDSDNS